MNTQPKPAMGSEAGPVGLGGWLILVGVGVCLAPIRLLFELRYYPDLFTDGTFAVLTDPGFEGYHPFWGPLILGELAFNVLMLLATLLLVGLFFTRHHWFPRFYILLLILSLLFIPIDIWLTTLVLPGEVVLDNDSLGQLVRLVVSSVIWIPYMLRSRRVRNTFVRGRQERTLATAYGERGPMQG